MRTLVRLLVCRRGELVSRDLLTEVLWPRSAPADPGASLNVLVNRARRALGEPSPIVTGTGGYLFVDDDSWVIDAEVFLAGVEAGRRSLSAGNGPGALREFRAALERWGGDPLPEDAYADWADGYRATLLRAHQECLEGAAAAALGARAAGEAVVFSQQAVAAEPLRESANLALVRSLVAAGDQAGALAAFDHYRRRLDDELGLDPSKEAFDLQARVIRHEPLVTPGVRPPSPPAPPSVELAFVGRDDEVDMVLAALSPGATGMALIAGRSGAGKSRLLAEVAHRVSLAILSARAFLPERHEPWSLGRSLLREVLVLDPGAVAGLPSRAVAALVDVVPELEELVPLPAVTIDPESRRALALHGAVRLLAGALPEGGVVMVDDLQWADGSSLELLRRAKHQVEELRLILAYRPDEVGSDSPVAAFLASPEWALDAATVALGPLPPRAIAGLVSDKRLAELIATATDGTPFAVMEVIRAMWERGMVTPGPGGTWRTRSGEAITVASQAATAGQQRAVERRVEQQPPPRRELLRLLALLGREVPARVLAAASAADEAAVLGDLDALARADLVRLGNQGWATAHDLITDTVATRLERSQAARLHAALARALEADDADPAELARHRLGAGDVEAAAGAFARAAEQRVDRFANEEAESLAESGLELAPSAPVRAALHEARAEARSRRGDLHGARSDLRAALSLVREGARRSRILSRMAMLAFGAEDLIRAGELVEVALAAAGSDPVARARALAVGAVTDMNLERPERAAARSEEALTLFEASGDARGVADILDGRGMGRFLSGDITGALGAFDRVARLFEDAGDLLRVVTPRSTRGHGLVFAARPDLGLSDTTEALELARALGYPEGQTYALWHQTEALSALGRHDEARRSAEEALAIAEAIGHRGWTATALRALGIALQDAGALEEAEAAFRRSLELSEHLSLFASWASARLAQIRLAQGDPTAAEPFVTRALSEGPPLGHYEARLARAELAAARAEPEAAAIARDALARAESGGHRASVPRLAILATPQSPAASG